MSKRKYLIFVLFWAICWWVGCTSSPSKVPRTGALAEITKYECKPVFKTLSVGTMINAEGLTRPYEVTWLILREGERKTRVLWSTTKTHAPILLDKNETYVFLVKTMTIDGKTVPYLYRIMKGDKTLIEGWMHRPS